MRLIDADALYDKAETWYKGAPTPYRKIYRSFVDIIADAPTITPPPNDPLTMAKLRETEGKPVPVWCDKENGYIFIAATKTEPYNQVWYFNNKGFAHTVLYYSTKFYRRKPESKT